MGLADEFERRLERVVEGVFSKAFRSEVEPAEIGRRLLRTMEEGKSVSVGAVYVPNDYVISLSREDHDRLEGLMPTLRSEFRDLLKQNARERRWRLPGPVDVRFAVDESASVGKFDVTALHVAGAVEEDLGAEHKLVLLGDGEGKEWRLDREGVTLGRSSSNEVVINDPNVSRSHAQVVLRDDEWWVIDLGSTNGTLVNGMLIKERRLVPGDRIKLGATELEFQEVGSGSVRG
ncbi:MAG: DUF3662 domain-containing protein [Actinomycetota bacterium]|nr:DUF3662 domain-containing protein [Actinomycetota bacterium]